MKDQCAVFGHPVGHSLSPRVYGVFSEQTGQPCTFRLIDCPPDGFADAVARFGDVTGVMGANVTVPHKLAAFALCNATSERAQQAGAVNLLRFETRSWVFGDNTDGAGLLADLAHLGVELAGRRVLVIGAGGAARGILGPLLAAEPAGVVLANRDAAKATLLAGRFVAHGRIAAAPLAAPGDRFDVVINATSASLHGTVPAVPPSVLAPGATAYDLMYGDAGVTAFSHWALQHGAGSAYDGWGMLIEQAAESWEVWFGTRPDTGPLRDRGAR